VNSSVTSVASVSSSDEPDAILRSSESELLTSSSDTFGDTELGLHTFGDGATNVFFDDFAIQAELRATRTGFLPVIQQ